MLTSGIWGLKVIFLFFFFKLAWSLESNTFEESLHFCVGNTRYFGGSLPVSFAAGKYDFVQMGVEEGH